MTRETKIGLLVGLAFIIVIGILLSDHLTSTNEPQQAQLAQAGNNARSAVTTPGSVTVPVVTTVPPTQVVAPQQPVPTKEEVAPKQPPVEIVHIGAAPLPPQSPQRPAPPIEPATPQREQIAQVPPSNDPPTLSNQQNTARPGSLEDVANRVGEQLVPVGQNGQPQPPTVNGAKQYKAEAGDNLAKIAQKTLGAPSKANITAIIAANPTLQANPNLVVAGRAYMIPPIAAATPAPTPTPTPAPIQPTPAPRELPITENTQPQPTPTKPEYFYTVKAGDSLTKIAVIQLGTAGAVNAIKDLNQDVLKGGETIRPNMKLRLPAKPLASAS